MDARRPPRQPVSEAISTQTLLITFFGHHVRPTVGRTPIATETILTALDRLGVSNVAGRSTLSRMVKRGYLSRARRGRRAWYGITDQLAAILADGERRLFAPPVRSIRPDTWTLLTFSFAEDQREQRHSLRQVLAWNGFGPLRDGMWIAPGEVDTAAMLARLDVAGSVDAFLARTTAPTDASEMVHRAWKLDQIAERYDDFIDRWSGDGQRHLSPLARQVRIATEWQQRVANDPQLAAAHLPEGWPAMRAFELFQRTLASDRAAADAEYRSILDVLPGTSAQDLA